VALQPGWFAVGRLHRDVQLILAVAGLMSVSFFGIQNLIKVLYVLRLGYGLEYVGLFSGMGALAYMVMSLPGGALGSRFGPQPVMRAGGVVTVLGMVLLPLTERVSGDMQAAIPLLSQVLLAGGWALFNVNMAPALMSLTTAHERNNAFSFSSVSRGLGTFVGAVVGGFLPALFIILLGETAADPGPYRWSLWIGAALGVLALAPLIWLSPIDTRSDRAAAGPETPFPRLWVALIVLHVILAHAAFATCQSFCNAYMDTELGLSAASIGLLTGAGQFAAMFAPLLVPTLAQRYNNRWTLSMATVGMAVSLAPLVLFAHWLAAGLGRLGMMALEAMWLPALQVFQMETVAARWRSLSYGIVSMMMALAFASVSLAGGYIIAAWGYRPLFLMGIVTSLMGAALMSRTPLVVQETVTVQER
jgi:MFS family permease